MDSRSGEQVKWSYSDGGYETVDFLFCPKCSKSLPIASVSAKEWEGADNPDIIWARIRAVVDCPDCGRGILRLFLRAPRGAANAMTTTKRSSEWMEGYLEGKKDAMDMLKDVTGAVKVVR